MKKFISVIVVYVIFTSSVFASEVNFYVSPSGNDQNPGTRELPVSTLTAARDLVRKYKSIHDLPADGITVWVSGGTYYLQESFALNENDSGIPGVPVVWRAVDGEKVYITGGISIAADAFHKISDKSIRSRLTNNAFKNVRCVDLKALGITNYGAIQRVGQAPVSPTPLELFFNREPMILARYPNEGFIPIGQVIDGGSIPRNGDYSNRGATFKYTDERHAVWAGDNDVWFQGTFCNGYATDQIHVEKIDPASKQVKLSTPHMYGVRNGEAYQHYFAFNILDELDMPGEYYLDRKTGILYFWPPSDLQKGIVMISIMEEPLVCLEGVSHLVFRDFTLEYGRGVGLYMERGQNNLIAGCTIRNFGTTGIFMGQGARSTCPKVTIDDYDGVPASRTIGSFATHLYKYSSWDRLAGTNHRIQSCDIYNTGTGGIILGGGNKRKLIAGNNVVENCRIHDYNRINKFGWGGVRVDGCGNKVSHCEIYNSDFHGIVSVGPEHLFEYNNIHHVTLNSDDVSAWYTGRNPSDRGLVVRYNYFHDCGNPTHMTMGVYCDDSTAGVTVFGNVFFNMHNSYGILYSNSGRDLTMKNNIVINPQEYTVELSPHYFTWYKGKAPEVFGKGKVFDIRLLKDVNIKEPPYSERYPELVNYMDVIVEGEEWEGMWTKRNVLSTNVIIGGNKDLIRIRQNGTGVFENVNNFQTTTDPGFVDMKSGNFMLRQDSEVFKKLPDFKPVPFDKMGLYMDEFRKVIITK
jgi:hypothetical protein